LHQFAERVPTVPPETFLRIRPIQPVFFKAFLNSILPSIDAAFRSEQAGDKVLEAIPQLSDEQRQILLRDRQAFDQAYLERREKRISDRPEQTRDKVLEAIPQLSDEQRQILLRDRQAFDQAYLEEQKKSFFELFDGLSTRLDALLTECKEITESSRAWRRAQRDSGIHTTEERIGQLGEPAREIARIHVENKTKAGTEGLQTPGRIEESAHIKEGQHRYRADTESHEMVMHEARETFAQYDVNAKIREEQKKEISSTETPQQSDTIVASVHLIHQDQGKRTVLPLIDSSEFVLEQELVPSEQKPAHEPCHVDIASTVQEMTPIIRKDMIGHDNKTVIKVPYENLFMYCIQKIHEIISKVLHCLWTSIPVVVYRYVAPIHIERDPL
jgi:hypothetical protein